MMNEQHETSAIATIHSIATPAAQGVPSSLQSFLLRSMFWRPTWLADSSSVEHIPFALWLVEVARPRLVVEVGIGQAVTYFAFCQAVDRLRLDTRCHGLYTSSDVRAASAEYEAARLHNEVHFAAFSRLSCCHVSQGPESFSAASIDLLHLNGTLASMEDFDAWLPKLSDRALVLIHGTENRESPCETPDLYAILKHRYPHFDFAQGEGLGLLGVGAQRASLTSQLFAANDGDHLRQGVQEVFARLGRACLDHQEAAKHRARVHDLSEQISSQQKQLEEVKQSLDKTKGDLNTRSKDLTEARARLQAQLEQHAVERGQLSERVNLLQEIRAELKDEMARLQGQIEAAQSELSRRTEEVKALAVEAGEHKVHIAIARTTLEARDSELTQSREALGRAKLDLAEAVAAQEKGAGELAIANATEAQRLAQVSELSARVQKAEAELERRGQEASQRDKAYRDQLAKLNAQSDSAQNELKERRYELQVASQRSTKLEGELQRLTELMAQAEQGLKDAELSHVAQTDALKADIEGLQAAQTGMQQSLQEATQEAAAARDSHGKLLGLVEERDAHIKTLRDDLARQIEDNECAAAALAKCQDTIRQKEEALALSHEEGARSLAEANALRDRLAERDAELHGLREQAVRLTQEVEQLHADNASFKTLRDDLARQVEDNKCAAAAALAMYQDTVREKEEALALSHEEGARSLAEANALRDRLAERDAELHGLREQAVRLTREVERLHADNTSLQTSLRQRFEETARLTGMLSEQESANRAAQQRQKDQLAELQNAGRALSELRQAAAQREASLSGQIALLTEKNGSCARDLDTAREALGTAADEARKCQTEHATLQAALKARDSELASRNAEVAKQADEISRHQEAIAQNKAALDARFAEIAKLTGMLTALEAQLSAQKERFDAAGADAESTRERLSAQLASARQQLAGQHDCVQALKQTASWRFTAPLRMVANAFRKSARLSPELQKDLKVLASSGLFDERWYLQRYDDVKQTGMNALEHYLRFGAAEGRDPGPRFSTAAYLSAYPDVAKSGSNPLVHYVKHGLGEGRVATVALQ
jgi:chromosome segregation ATPase